MIKQSQIQIEMNYTILFSTAIAINLIAIAEVQASNADYDFLIESDWHSCQQISSEYKKVYAFETNSFHVNICQKDNVYFYSGEAKKQHVNSIFIPAIPLNNQNGFEASNGNVSYVVVFPPISPNSLKNSFENSIDTEKAILTIKRNDQLVSVEPSLSKYCYQSDQIVFDSIELFPDNLNYLATLTQEHINLNLLNVDSDAVLRLETFAPNSRFNFYQLDRNLQDLAICS